MRSFIEVPDTGRTQVRVIGFGTAGVAAVSSLEKYPAPGLLFRQYLPSGQAGGSQMSTGTAAPSMVGFDSWLESAHILVLLVDENDMDLCLAAVELGRKAKAQGLLAIGVILGGNVSVSLDADQFAGSFFEEFETSMLSCIRLAPLGIQTAFDGTALLLQSLTTGLAKLCNIQGNIGVDYEDVLSVLGEPARLSAGVGAAQGNDRALVAAQAALAEVMPAVLSPESVQSALIMISASIGQLRLSETKVAMNTVRAALGEETHCVFGEYHNEPSVDQTITQTRETLQLTISLTSPFNKTMRSNATRFKLHAR